MILIIGQMRTSKNLPHQQFRSNTWMAVVMVLPTTPGSAFHVPNPTEGILAPVFNSKNRIPLAIIFSQNTC